MAASFPDDNPYVDLHDFYVSLCGVIEVLEMYLHAAALGQARSCTS